ncbi:hypothetical protein DVB69_14460 [Sporosarcina sp. BI001-red]|nr:hypothetical protein DVB69_14460 [Sporosarcina sp. BI001-red]
MKTYKDRFYLLLLVVVLCLVGCSPSSDKTDGYKKAGINEEFPVPATAKSSDVQFDNSTIEKGKKYRLKNIGGEQGLYPPSEYFEEINLWGWELLKEEQMGHANFFKKGTTVISVVIHEDDFELYEMKEGFPLN